MNDSDTTRDGAPEELSNCDRLLQHLKDGSLAARLVQEQKEGIDPTEALKAILMERLDQVKKELNGDEN